jgi:5'-3' exonuclease
MDADGVAAKFGVRPESIPDYLALVGDSADGFPGLPGWGAKSAAAVLSRYGHLDAIPAAAQEWGVNGVRNAGTLAATLREHLDLAVLFRRLATLDTDVEVGAVDDWRWTGPTPAFAARCAELGAPELASRVERLAQRRAG